MKNRLNALAVACGLVLAFGAEAAGVVGQGTWETTLLGRDINGKAVASSDASAVFLYDTTLNITWLRDANVNGRQFWDTANTWANDLVVGAYSDWRLPTMIDTGSPGCDISFSGGTDCGYYVQTKVGITVYSEMAHLYYETLGNKGYYDTDGNPEQPGWGLTNTGNFQNLGEQIYWSGLLYGPVPEWVWDFYMDVGYQYTASQFSRFDAMAVRPGDVLVAVPEPSTYALMLAGLAAVGFVARRRRA